jgi:hypothetical protein
MKLTVLYPAYFPNLLWWHKFTESDVPVLLDDYPYSSSLHINRTDIKSVNGKLTLTVPLSQPEKGKTEIRSVPIDASKNWRRTHLASLETNYRNAPYFEHYFPHLKSFYEREWSSFFDLCLEGIRLIQKLLRLEKEIHFSSETPVKGSREERVIQLLRRYNCSTYVIEEHSGSYFDPAVLEKEGYLVEFVKSPTHPYEQQFEPFIPGLSILDVLMNEGPYTIRVIGEK